MNGWTQVGPTTAELERRRLDYDELHTALANARSGYIAAAIGRDIIDLHADYELLTDSQMLELEELEYRVHLAWESNQLVEWPEILSAFQ